MLGQKSRGGAETEENHEKVNFTWFIVSQNQWFVVSQNQRKKKLVTGT